ncbi:hypothetical protein [Agromyces archimandritae]|uniref:Uncharacterized protein n=1 Tax=Agromyces archimandritae TaxID=2781962 RepID=A0A975IP81_9MICO|nr:hypothetical protein [Agromyces archimandritae]QTX05330.1 hypothetical protein G127AT_03635 [Agromyces archimandritae]
MILLALTACTNPDPKPVFEGAWAQEFADHYADAQDDFAREVLEDGVVSDQERSEMISRFKECAGARGITIDYHLDGTFETNIPAGLGPDGAHETISSCSESSGEDLIGSLYSQILTNPDNLDENQLIADCMVERGAVPAGYRGEEYVEDGFDGEYPYSIGEAKGEEIRHECDRDPLGLIPE